MKLQRPPITHETALARLIAEAQLPAARADAAAAILRDLAPQYLNAREAARRYGVSAPTIRSMYDAGKLRAFTFGAGPNASTLYSVADLDEAFRPAFAAHADVT